MPPRLPDRYRLNIRLGSDGDIEEWFAQDETLDRPVIIRYLAPESSPARRASFLESVRSAAALRDVHIQSVFAAGETSASAYSVSEWDGGVTIADRLRVEDTLPFTEFLPNAAGICLALSRLHAEGGVHGAIDASAIRYSAAHPVKLGAFGRQSRWVDAKEDTRALAEVLRAAITGTHDSSVFPSHVINGALPSVDDALRAGIAGSMDAAALSRSLKALPQVTELQQAPVSPWRSLAVFGFIIMLIAGIAAIGLAADFDPESPVLYPITAEPIVPPPPVPLEALVLIDDSRRLDTVAAVYDPLGDGTESDEKVPYAHDGDRATSWPTETYSRPLHEVKAGVGLVFVLEGTPTAVSIVGTPETVFLLGWSRTLPAISSGWEHIARGTLQSSESRVELPLRDGGMWLFWITELPQQPEGSYQAKISEIRFAP